MTKLDKQLLINNFYGETVDLNSAKELKKVIIKTWNLAVLTANQNMVLNKKYQDPTNGNDCDLMIKYLIDFIINFNKIFDWILTDPDQKQYLRYVEEYKYIIKDKVTNGVLIDFNNYKYKDIESSVSSYGYTLLDNYLLDGYDRKSSHQLIAECLFETYESELFFNEQLEI